MYEVLIIALTIILSFSVAIVIDRFGVPRISSYVIVGILLSKDLLGGILNVELFQKTGLITDILLGVIAFLIGLALDVKTVSKMKSLVIIGTFGQVFGTVLIVTLGLLIISHLEIIDIKPEVAILLGAIAATTDSAGTLGVIEEYKAVGPMTTVLLGIVILDDALGIITFEFLVRLLTGDGLWDGLLQSSLEMFNSILIGCILGSLLGLMSRRFTEEEMRFPIYIGFILLAVSSASLFGASHLLTCISMGFFTQFISKQDPKEVILPIKHIEEFIFIIFFILAGTHFDIGIFREGLSLLIAYILLRAIGKYLGAYWGVSIAGRDTKFGHLVGLGLLPQAGIAIGLAISLTQHAELVQYRPLIFNLILGATVFYELAGPVLTKISLKKAGEIVT